MHLPINHYAGKNASTLACFVGTSYNRACISTVSADIVLFVFFPHHRPSVVFGFLSPGIGLLYCKDFCILLRLWLYQPLWDKDIIPSTPSHIPLRLNHGVDDVPQTLFLLPRIHNGGSK